MEDLQLLDTDLSTIDLSRQLIAAGLYDLRIENAEIAQSSSGKRMLTLELVTTAPSSSHDGKPVPAGDARVYDNCMLEPSGRSTMRIVTRNLASIVQSAGLSGVKTSNIDQWHKQLCGQVVRCRVDLEPERTNQEGRTFDPRNSIAGYLPKN